MMKQLCVTSSPHLRSPMTTKRIMQIVCLALAPSGIAGIVLFGWNAAALIITSVLACVLSEYAFQWFTHQKITIGDWSAVVTGLLLAYNLPANAPLWLAVIGSIIAIVLVKQFFGGIGCNFVNPALAARAILFVSWASLMADYPKTIFMPDTVTNATGTVTAVSTASPLAKLAAGEEINLWNLLIGNCSGVLGETCKIAIIIGGLYLIIRGIADWRIPLTFIGTAFVCYLIKCGFDVALIEILSGGLMLGAFFMATDYTTSPMAPIGKIIMGIGCGLLVFIIREYATYIEGCSFAILFMNVLTPMIDKFTVRKSFGEVKQHA